MSETRSWRLRLRPPLPPWRGSPRARTARFAAVSAVAGLVVAGTAVGAAGPWEGGQRKAERARAAADTAAGGGRPAQPVRPDAPPVLAALGGRATAPQPTRDGLGGALDGLLKDSALGAQTSAAVVDVATGQQLFGSDQDTPYTPASTIKTATAAAALAALGPAHRIETTAVADGDTVVLVGGGDPTLTARPAKEGAPPAASLKELADATARGLKARGKGRVKVAYDASRYSGPAVHPIGPNENIAPVSALTVDEGRLDDSDHGPAERTADPAGDAGRKFAGMLREAGVDVDGDPAAGRAGEKAERLASVSSPPLSALVERTLTNSDNDIAEALARQTALASGQPADFEGAARAVTGRLEKLGLPLSGARIADGSGLDRADHVSAAFLASLLARAADPARPELRPVLTGLPVAGFSGTLSGRYGADAAGRGVVRAKTGTLTGVNTLSGTVVDADGRLLSFAFMTTGAASGEGAQGALDRLATAVAGCGCR
ncbi:D-alanyl-D-alanine carboxypeptidase/D-alanyl-D-alanine-endopeptidase [Streptomyces rectiverticillatus]|uniref:D-alanyl-D-alanine carboxypeptidase/D-alanyl-D-alanine endopeptidase n=1 Tax=Streptomyces rectiverticillatus TaxID=173860 RepID=UPI0015C36E1D|nr:D-alanyl-D-alanine carboxypeptidase/D-alanyl-D-alanine-endopeptidase [Streptomyces rectiverticillatus]QLE73279.1 D-alanyl-D-alanine carboxypeptidase/D-alanyl-D-alanine-endopeptidase [Streptomyces rectiverticillatus]